MASLGAAQGRSYLVGVYGSGRVCSNITVSSVVSRTVSQAWTGGASYRGWDNRQIATKTGPNGIYEIKITLDRDKYLDVIVSKLQHAGGWHCVRPAGK